jgi:ubiquitin-protein ligase
MDIKGLLHEFMKINFDRNNIYEDQARIDFPQGTENVFHLMLILTPKYGPFRGAKLQFQVDLPKNYPNSQPTIKCLTKVFHPNIK